MCDGPNCMAYMLCIICAGGAELGVVGICVLVLAGAGAV